MVNKTGTYTNNSDGSIQTCQNYTDAATACLSSGLAANVAASALGVSLTATQAT